MFRNVTLHRATSVVLCALYGRPEAKEDVMRRGTIKPTTAFRLMNARRKAQRVAHQAAETVITADAMVAALRANTDALYADQITNDEHATRNRAIWATIEAVPGMAERVSDLIWKPGR
jgi:hypothetical protein